jgi:hypothetical protein
LALNEIETLNYIICELRLFHNNSINYANKINASLLNNSSSQNQKHSRCGCGCGHGCGYGRDFGRRR